jgi:hypothetical protein
MEISENRKELYAKYREELLKLQLSSSEALDKSILSLSSAGIGASLIFIRYIVSLSQVINIYLLHLAWFFFTLAIVLTLFSYISTQVSINKQLLYAKKYYLEKQSQFLQQLNLPAKITYWLTIFSVLSFFTAILLLISFLYINTVNMGGSPMTQKGKIQKGLGLKKGRLIPDMLEIQEDVSLENQSDKNDAKRKKVSLENRRHLNKISNQNSANDTKLTDNDDI